MKILNIETPLWMTHFRHKELACPMTGKVRFAEGFADVLVDLREAWNKPFKVISCCRSREYNAQKQGHPNSLHIYDTPYHNNDGTAALDVAVKTPQEAFALAMLAYNLGWSVGVGTQLLHLDRRGDWGLPSRVLFHVG